MTTLKIHLAIQSRYQVFDRSGSLPFSIVFGLCRQQSEEDTDPRPLVLNTANSILDLPYALSQKLLTLRGCDAESINDTEIDVGQLSQPEQKKQSYLTLPSPVGRTENWKKCMSTYRYDVDPESELASLLEPGKKYTIRNKAGQDLGFRDYAYSDQAESRNEQEESFMSGEIDKLVAGRVNGHASFSVVSSLPWPPKLQTRMQRCRTEDGHTSADSKERAKMLEITVLNSTSEDVTIQTRGRQRFLIPSGPMDTEDTEEHCPALDPRPRIIDAAAPAPKWTIQIIDIKTYTVVRPARKPSGFVQYQLTDPRPRLENLVTLKPGEPLVRHVDITEVITGLPDGTYGLRMEPRGMWWCLGNCGDFAVEDGEHVPQRLFTSMIPPLTLECEDVVEVQIHNGAAI
jgi:hypothetical protein